ncbi:hypothetical protein EIP91_001440 [Steccherinum ochraceum]|uniref:Uncharacterized protein n=1 Tax=Steccherinum ochraceum TaxID=92696 RepID=A0A4R0RE44_9APHY|nr:hypothetical protein EIP91_001440 [Steccherinum ochraceum]
MANRPSRLAATSPPHHHHYLSRSPPRTADERIACGASLSPCLLSLTLVMRIFFNIYCPWLTRRARVRGSRCCAPSLSLVLGTGTPPGTGGITRTLTRQNPYPLGRVANTRRNRWIRLQKCHITALGEVLLYLTLRYFIQHFPDVVAGRNASNSSRAFGRLLAPGGATLVLELRATLSNGTLIMAIERDLTQLQPIPSSWGRVGGSGFGNPVPLPPVPVPATRAGQRYPRPALSKTIAISNMVTAALSIRSAPFRMQTGHRGDWRDLRAKFGCTIEVCTFPPFDSSAAHVPFLPVEWFVLGSVTRRHRGSTYCTTNRHVTHHRALALDSTTTPSSRNLR